MSIALIYAIDHHTVLIVGNWIGAEQNCTLCYINVQRMRVFLSTRLMNKMIIMLRLLHMSEIICPSRLICEVRYCRW